MPDWYRWAQDRTQTERIATGKGPESTGFNGMLLSSAVSALGRAPGTCGQTTSDTSQAINPALSPSKSPNAFATMAMNQLIAQSLYLYELARSKTGRSGYGGVHKSRLWPPFQQKDYVVLAPEALPLGSCALGALLSGFIYSGLRLVPTLHFRASRLG
jgi:hypothetical protein